MRIINRVRVDGVCEAADRLRVMLAKCSFLLVPDSSAAYTFVLEDGPALALDSVDSPLEAKIEDNLEELHARFPGAGEYLKRRAGGNRDPQRCVVTVPPGLHEAVALAILRAVVQVSEQLEPVPVSAPTPAPAAPRRPWYKFWAALFVLIPSLASAQATPPFQQLDVDTAAALSPRVFVGLFTPASGGATAVALPTTLDGGGFRVAVQNTVTVTDGAGALNVICDSGCGSPPATADNSVFTGGTTNVTPIAAVFDTTPPTITDGNYGAPRMDSNRYLFTVFPSAQAVTATATDLDIRNLTGATDTVTVTDGAGALNVICDSGCGGAATFADNAAFTFGTTAINISGFVLDDVTPNAATENSAAAPRMASNRVPYAQLRDAAGNERGANVTAGNALVVDGSAVTQPVSGTVTANVGTFPDNEPFNVAQINGVAPLMGNGVTGTGSQRVTIASDNTAFTVNVGTFPDNEPINAAQWGGVAVLAGNGVSGTGAPRVSIASDSTGPAYNGATASAVPARAAFVGTNSTGNLVGLIGCDNHALLNMSTATTTEIVALTAGQIIYVCSYDVMAGGTSNVKFVRGTGTNCATGQADISSNYPLIAQTGISRGSGLGTVFRTTSGNALCVTSSAAVTVAVDVTYTKF